MGLGSSGLRIEMSMGNLEEHTKGLGGRFLLWDAEIPTIPKMRCRPRHFPMNHVVMRSWDNPNHKPYPRKGGARSPY